MAATIWDTPDRRGLIAWRDLLGDQFVAGYILNTGEHAARFADRISAAPIDRLWHPVSA